MHPTTERAASERRTLLPGGRIVAGAALAIAAIAAVVAIVGGNDDDTLRISNLPEGVTAHVVDGNDLFVARFGTEVRAFIPDGRRLPDDTVWWCPNEQIFIEIERGSQFDRDGLHIAGPAPGALNQHPVELDGDQVIINTDRVIQGALASAGGRSPERADDSGSGRWPPNSGPDSICQDPVAAPPSAARQLEPHTGPQH